MFLLVHSSMFRIYIPKIPKTPCSRTYVSQLSPSILPTPTNHPTTTPLPPLGVKKLTHSGSDVSDVTSNPQHNVDSVEAVAVSAASILWLYC